MPKLYFLSLVFVATQAVNSDRYQVERRSGMDLGTFEQLRQLVCMMDNKDTEYCE